MSAGGRDSPDPLNPEPQGEPPESLELGGSGRHFLWSVAPPLATTFGAIFLLGFSIRRIGPTSYGAAVAISSALALLTLVSGALRIAVVRAGASHASPGGQSTDDINGAHAMFVGLAVGLPVVALALGWLIPVDLGLTGATAWHVYLATFISACAAAVLIATATYDGVLTAQERYNEVAAAALAGFATQFVVTLLLVGWIGVVGISLAILAGALVHGSLLLRQGRRRAPWLSFRPRRPPRAVVMTIVRYAGGITVLSATSTICASSDAFVLGGFKGGAAVTVFRVGSAGPLALAGLLYLAFGVLFPRIVKSASAAAQEEGVGWLGGVVGWGAGIMFAAMALLGNDLIRLVIGHHSSSATHVLWVCAAAMCLDICYHGVVQVVLARGQQTTMAKASWVELLVNLTSTVVGVALWGPIGSAIALAITMGTMDLVVFPFIMRDRWLTPPGRFVLRNGVTQSVVAAGLTLGIGRSGFLLGSGLWPHVASAVGGSAVTVAVGYLLLGRDGKTRLRSLVAPTPTEAI